MQCQICKKENVSEYNQNSQQIQNVFSEGGPTFQNPKGGGAGSGHPLEI